MSAALILGLVGGLLVVAFLANRAFGLARIPDVLVLMMLGVLLGHSFRPLGVAGNCGAPPRIDLLDHA